MLTNSYFNDAAAHKPLRASIFPSATPRTRPRRSPQAWSSARRCDASASTRFVARASSARTATARARSDERSAAAPSSASALSHVAGRRSADTTAGGGSVPSLRVSSVPTLRSIDRATAASAAGAGAAGPAAPVRPRQRPSRPGDRAGAAPGGILARALS